ncbi:MAG: hypothetical protein ACXACY_25455 [Candidatus Hodarchaeales archaeon]
MKPMKSFNKKISPEIRYILLLFFFTRLILTTIGLVSRKLIGVYVSGGQYRFFYSQHLWLDLWSRWDSCWYLEIARNWYRPTSFSASDFRFCDSYFNAQLWESFPPFVKLNFFPMYPSLIKLLGELTGNFYVAGLIISNVSLILACVFLYRLVRLESDETTALNSVKYLFLFPTAFIFSGVFSESLFLALLIGAFYYAKNKNWMAAGTLGFFLSLTRSIGVVVFLPLLYEYLKEKDFKPKRFGTNIFYLLLIPLGLLSFAAYNYYLTGDFLMFANIAESFWHHGLINPFKLFYFGLFYTSVSTAFPLLFTLIFLVILNVFYKKIGFTYWLLGIILILIPLLSASNEIIVQSMPRYILIIFPLYILFAKLSKNPQVDQLLTISLALIQGFLMVYWVFFLLII